MNRKFVSKAIQGGLCAGAMLLCAAAASASSSLVTFQIDMTVATQNGPFNPSTEGVAARGTFDGWATPGFPLTNNPNGVNGVNTNLYSGTYDDTTDANGGVTDWQFVITTNGGTSVANYSTQDDSDNYCAFLPATSGGSVVVPTVFWDDDGPAVTNAITFQVDMAEQLHLGNFNTSDTVYCLGSFEGWSDANFPLTNNPALDATNAEGTVTSLVYEGTYNWSASSGAPAEYKFVYNNGSDQYEAPKIGDPDNNNNRFLMNEPQVLPLVSYSDVPFADTVTNNVTFEIDMTTQIGSGNFNTNAAPPNTVEIHGDYDGWGGATTLTNDPAVGPNIYTTTIQYVGAAGQERYFKYVIQPGTEWENFPANDPNITGGNRFFFLANTNGNLLNGPIYFSDEPPSSLIDFVIDTNCMVTFTVNMTNATGTGPGGTYTFDNSYPSGDSIYINGLNNGINNSFWTWGGLPPSNYQMTQVPNTFLFTITLPINEGQNDDLTYKYSIDGYDDEAASGDNHQRWIRSLPDYTMPVDTYGEPTSEIPAGDLSIMPLGGNQVLVSWLGRRGVHLQTAASLPGVWTDQDLTDGTNLIVAPGGMATTNYTIGSSNVFYRLVGPD